MTPFTVGLLGIGVLFLLLASGIPVGFAMGLVGFLGFGYLTTVNASLSIMGIVPYSTCAAYDMSVLPLFILMGQFALHGRLTGNLYSAGHKWLGHLPGGLAMATIGASAGFAAISGSTVASSATMAEVALPEMKRYKYAPSLAAGCVAAGGGLGILIPPSGILIIYGILAEESIGKLFAAGVIPGVILSALHMLTIYILVKTNPRLAPATPRASWREKIIALKDTWQVLLLFAVVMGGIWTGAFTVTEAAAIGAIGALFLALANRGLTWRNLGPSLKQTTQTTAMIFTIIIGAMLFGYFLSVTRLPMELADWIVGLGLSRYIVLTIIIVTFIVLGCVMDSLAMVLLTMPIFLPVVGSLGFNTIWFGVIVILVVEMGVITPPVGMNVYVISGVARDIPLEVIFRGIFPFLISDIVCTAILIVFPQIALFLPSLLK
jgi:tripartite ATP-independent transporter DctM subunit